MFFNIWLPNKSTLILRGSPCGQSKYFQFLGCYSAMIHIWYQHFQGTAVYIYREHEATGSS